MTHHPMPVNQTGLDGIFRYANSVSDNIYGPGIMLGLYIIIFSYLRMRGENTENCLIAAGFITSIASVFAFFLDIISDTHLFIAITMFTLSLLLALWNRD